MLNVHSTHSCCVLCVCMHIAYWIKTRKKVERLKISTRNMYTTLHRSAQSKWSKMFRVGCFTDAFLQVNANNFNNKHNWICVCFCIYVLVMHTVVIWICYHIYHILHCLTKMSELRQPKCITFSFDSMNIEQ